MMVGYPSSAMQVQVTMRPMSRIQMNSDVLQQGQM
jgi:hypothetical protein